MSTNKEYADGLRQLADWFEANDDIEHPESEISCYSLNEKEDAARVLKTLKPCKKEYDGNMFYIKRDFGAITLRYVFMRNAVCTPRVVERKVTPAYVVPAHTVEEYTVPEKIEEKIEWDCEPILETKPVAEVS